MTKEESLLINFSRLDEKEREKTISHVRRLFIVREDTYAVQKVTIDGKQNYIRIDQPLTDEVLLKHFRGEITVGTYQLDTEARVKWGCLDLDGEHVTDSKEKTRRLWHRLVNLGLKSDQILLEESGSENSYHIWIFFEEATSAKKAKAFLEWVARPIDPKIEVFPKQEKVGEEGYGNLVKIPLGFHKAAKRWSNCFLQKGEGEGVTGFETWELITKCKLPKVPTLKTLGLRPCFKRAIEEQWVLKGPEGDVFRLALAGEMLTNDYSDEEMHSVFALQSNYNYERTQEKLAYSKANGYHTWKCESITAQCSGLLAGMCEGCTRTSEGLDVKEDITAREGKGDNTKAPKHPEETKQADAKAAAKRKGKGKEEQKKQNATEKIILLALSHGELVHDQHNEGFALIDGMGGNKKALKLRTREFKIFLAKLVWDAEAQGIGSDVLNSALNTLEGKALFDGKACFLYNRIGSNAGSIFYDLGDERVIQINSAGWHFVEDAPTLFRKEQHQKPQVTPTKGGDINKLWTIINLKDKGDRVLFVACLVSMFMDNIDHPIPVWIGEQGSGKTVSSETVKSLIDPSSLETTALSKDEESFLLTLYHNWLSIFDNVGEVKPWQSDILSRAITGGGLSRRRRYTDEEEQLYNFRRCIMINGLLLPLTAPDVMDRSLLFKLSRFKQHLSRKEIEENFEGDKPEIFGALLDLVAKTLKILETEEIAAPPGIRLYDFGVVGEAAARAYGAKNGDFSELLLKKKADDNLEVIQSSLFGSVLYSLIDNGGYIGAGDAKYPFLDKERKWVGGASELLEIFSFKASELSIDRRQKEWKGSPRGLSTELEKLKTNFRAVGVVIERGREHQGRYINILVKKESPLYNVILRHDRHDRHENQGGEKARDACDVSDANQLTLREKDEKNAKKDGTGLDAKSDGENIQKHDVLNSGESPVTQNNDKEECISKIAENVKEKQDVTRPTKITSNICEEKSACQECGYGGKWGVDLPYLIHYQDGKIKTVCKRCGERITKEFDFELPPKEVT